LFEKVRGQIQQSHNEFRELLRPMQRAKFEIDVLKMSAGLGIAEQKLQQWKRGEFASDDFWEPLPADRQRRREERRRRRAEADARQESDSRSSAVAKPADQIEAELLAWEKYVEVVIRMFHFDEGQRSAALSCLAELKERALAHRDRRREDITRLEHRLENHTGSSDKLADLKRQLTELYGPIDDMFQELKARLDQLPTGEQRASAAKERTEQRGHEPPEQPSSPDP
jgi:hypothetical protein